jgi:hypothetical protein
MKPLYIVSDEYFTDNSVFKTLVLPNGRIVKILNRKIHEEALKQVTKSLIIKQIRLKND